MPDYLVPLDYAATGTTITRITDQMAFGVDDRVLKHDYSRRAAWNADGSRLLLVNPYPALIFDASDFTRWETHQTPVDALWSNTDPATLFGLTQGTVLVRYSIASRVETPLRVFNGYSHLSIGGGEGVQSDDDRRLVLIGERTGGIDVILYDLVDDEVRLLPIDGAIGSDEDVDWAGISPSGDYLVVKFNRDEAGERGFDVYDSRSLARLRRLLPGSEAHADMGYDQAGREVLVSSAEDSSAIVSVRLTDGVVREELSADVVSSNVHVSCRNIRRPGWCYVSTFSEEDGRTAYLYRGIFSIRLDGSGLVERYAPAFFAEDPVDLAYVRQAWAVPSPLGDQVLFASDWGDGSDEAVVNDFVAGVSGGPRAAPPAAARSKAPGSTGRESDPTQSGRLPPGH